MTAEKGASVPPTNVSVSCPTCGAQPGAWCGDLRVGFVGRYLIHSHPARVRARQALQKADSEPST